MLAPIADSAPSFAVKITANPRTGAPSRDPELKEIATPPSLIELAQEPAWASNIYYIESLDDVAIRGSYESTVVKVDDNVSAVDSGPLFGLHNRDWPTLQALDFLSRMAKTELVPLEDFYQAATANAWRMADFFNVLENKSTGKLTSLLPNNPRKPGAAESNYRNFVISCC